MYAGCNSRSVLSSLHQLWEVYGERRLLRTFVGKTPVAQPLITFLFCVDSTIKSSVPSTSVLVCSITPLARRSR